MAKLTGVKTLDMVNGEITKIEYNGEVYEKVGTDSPQIDGFFKLKEEAPAEELFAKVNRPNNEPIVGDFVEFDLSDYDKPYFKVGKKYEVDEDKDVIDEEGHVLPLYNSNRPIKSIFVKYTQEQAEQEAEVGDKILIVDEDVVTHGYSNGDVVEVTDDFGSGIVKGDGTCVILPREYIVLTDAQAGGQGEQSEDVAESEQTTPKVGDYVVALQEEVAEAKRQFEGSKIEVGDLVKVVNSPSALPNGSYFIVKDIASDGKILSTFYDGEFDKRSHKWHIYGHKHVELIAKAADVYA